MPVELEWLEPDGLGGFASGTVAGQRTRRYHALLLAATTPPTGRMVLVNGFDAWLERPGLRGGRRYLTSQRYTPDVTTGDAAPTIGFTTLPWPTWTHRLAGGLEVSCELFVPRGAAVAALRWRARNAPPGLRLVVRPFLSGRDAHALHHENPSCRADATAFPERVRWQPYPSVPAVLSLFNGSYVHAPVWYRGFQLDEERARGFEYLEDCLSPGLLSWDLAGREAVWILGAMGLAGTEQLGSRPAAEVFRGFERAERARRAAFPSRLHRAADAYLVRRGDGETIVAGYPWFTDWGRDTFIALRGICLATGRLDAASGILRKWAGTVSQGMLPNRFVDQGGEPEFNSVDASLWFGVAVWEYLRAAEAAGRSVGPREQELLVEAIRKILAGYLRGTRYGIRMDRDGLLQAGVPGVQLTWMDAKLGDRVVTPRIGKPVEVQALWLNALRIGAAFDPAWTEPFERGLASFRSRFWNAERGCLYDVVDADGVAGKHDASVRPNQILAVGGLPFPMIEGDEARKIVATVKRLLQTPMGLRSLAPDDPAYRPRYAGGPAERDSAYHQGTVWPWLVGPFVEAWLRTEGDTPAVRAEIRSACVDPLLRHLDEAGLGHVSEVADGDPPHTPGGCPFQAWSVGELLRVVALLDAQPEQGAGAGSAGVSAAPRNRGAVRAVTAVRG